MGAKGGPKTGGRVKGTPNKRTQDVLERLDDLGCDPLELSAKIALGQELDGPHPDYAEARALLDDLAAMAKDAIIPDSAAEALRKLSDYVDAGMGRGYVPLELRSKHIADLMQYAHPKRKAVDVTTNGNPVAGLVQVYLPTNQRDSTPTDE